MFNTSDIYTVSDFNRKPSEHIKRLSRSKRPEILTVNGKAAVIVQDAKAYEEMAKRADMMDSI
ncbi:MAG TPA: type II toxin-antitoxin system Phd/YefM family antitoxin, partial [Ignavibacteria bacterium]|nr:type II toxin-antitoxin system Phd/YefM family antitoxin [Ignavibacteria bacterium]